VRSYRTFSPLPRRRSEPALRPRFSLLVCALTSDCLRASCRFTTTTRRYVFCGTFRPTGLNRPSRTLSGTLLCGVRTFLCVAAAIVRSSCQPCHYSIAGGNPAQIRDLGTMFKYPIILSNVRTGWYRKRPQAGVLESIAYCRLLSWRQGEGINRQG